ncbi:hypothetical protein NL676_018082 [Syzygium grande]|nr:hypothetical protein NL676_018082 [Syzygium grande]
MFNAIEMLQLRVKQLIHDLDPRPGCIISNTCVCYTLNITWKFNVPRVLFYATSCLCLLCLHCFRSLKNDSDGVNITKSSCGKFVLSGLPDRLEFTERQFPMVSAHLGLEEFFEKCMMAELASYGVVMNSFEELEPAYAEEYKKVRGDNRVWCIGPVSLCNKDHLDLAQRGAQLRGLCLPRNLVQPNPARAERACVGKRYHSFGSSEEASSKILSGGSRRKSTRSESRDGVSYTGAGHRRRSSCRTHESAGS